MIAVRSVLGQTKDIILFVRFEKNIFVINLTFSHNLNSADANA